MIFRLKICFFSLFLFSFPYISYASIDDGLVAHYTFDEGSGKVAHDSSEKGNTGTLVNGVTWSSGKVGSGAVNFDGVDDYIESTNNFISPSTATISLWMKTNGSAESFSVATYADKSFNFYAGNPHKIGYTAAQSYSGGPTANKSIDDGTWHHIVGTTDGSVQTLYIDGNVENTMTFGAALNSGKFYAGKGFMGAYTGLIDDVRLYDSVLSLSQIKELYALGTSVSSSALSAPVNLRATVVSSSQIDLSWTGSSDSRVSGYKIYRGNVQIGTSNSASYSDTQLDANTSYTYTVSAHDADGNNSSQSSSINASTKGEETNGPCEAISPAVCWYVDSSISVSGNGTTWSRAWKNVNNITGVSPGDFVYISGGPSGSSQTYSAVNLVWKPLGGTVGKPITYKIGQDSAHNGTAIFDGSHLQNPSYWLTYPNNGTNLTNAVISGDAGDGKRHFTVQNYSAAFVCDFCKNLRISYITFTQGAFDMEFGAVNGIEIDHNYMYADGSNLDHFSLANFNTGTGWDSSMKFHDNTVYAPGDGRGMGADALQWAGIGFSIYNNTFYGYVTNYTGGQHQDGWQGQGSYIKIYGNTFYGIPDYAIYGDLYSDGGSTSRVISSHMWIYNNIIIGSSGGIVVGHEGWYTGTADFDDIVIANNVVDHSFQALDLGNPTEAPSTFTNSMIVNNIVIADPTPVNLPISTRGTNGTVTVSNNAILTSAQAASYFKNYTAKSQTSDFHILSSADILINKGLNKSLFFSTDKDGVTRPATGSWDIGAYQYCTSNCLITQPTDHISPVLSSISASKTSTTAIITWSTNEAATTQVQYGLTPTYGNATAVVSTLTIPHSVSLSSLTPNTTYHYKVISTDAAGNTTTSNDGTFTTPAVGVTTPSATPPTTTGANTAPGSSLNTQTNSNGGGLNSPCTATTSPILVSRLPTTTFLRTLTLGSTGADVEALQVFLNTHNFSVSATGIGSRGLESTYYGPATQKAVARFQAANQITPAVGNFGPLTRTKVNALSGVSNSSSANSSIPCTTTTPATITSTVTQTTPITFTRILLLGSVGADVKALQVFLNTHGYAVATTGAGSRGYETTTFGPATRRALVKFQVANQIVPANGYFGAVTRERVKGLR